MFDGLAKLPLWQRILLFVFVSAAIVGGWYYFFYLDAVDARTAADKALATAETELVAAKAKRDNFDSEQARIAEAEKQIAAQRDVLPLNASTVDNLMQTFQQQSRLVGMNLESWQNGDEELEDFYARMPIKIRATGTWQQVGEFFRRVSELKRIVSVDKLALKAREKEDLPPGEHPRLEVEFEAATYRFLTDGERESATDKSSRGKGRRKK